MWVSNSVPGCGPRSRGVRGSLADRREEAKKRLSCVTMRGRNLGVFISLGHNFGSLAALLLRLGVLSSDIVIPATFGLAPGRLPAANLPQAVRLLTVALVPAPRLVLATASLSHAASDARPARSSPTAMISRNLASAHGRSCSQGKARGECANILLEHHQNINQSDAS
jgi:hypothetical protein